MTIQTIAMQHFVFSTSRNVLAGAGICYALQNQKYIELPLTIVFPSVYAGYQLYNNKEKVAQWIKDFRK